MPLAQLNGIDLNYDVTGDGPLVVLVMGTGSPGRVWRTHQVPALVKSGYGVVTFDNRGIAPSSECARGMTLDDLVADTAALIEHLGGGKVRVVGTSMGARVTQELALARPDLVSHAVMMATYGRNTTMRQQLTKGEKDLFDAGVELPASYRAAMTAMQNFSPKTLADEAAIGDWLAVLEYSGGKKTAGMRAQIGLEMRAGTDRLTAYRRISAKSLVVGFADDRLIPVQQCREVAAAIPGARYVEIADTGHFGYLERPDAVNATLVEFLAS
ncbi:alpha/beta hydrolase [Rhodococcus fascians]|nr:alpha/beta hydrolase [Rhodococcus fascians]MBY4021418.1 alpha/beta hydrolase [Rhodococcus fascians]